MASSAKGCSILDKVVVLIGPPGSGKSTVGRKLANRWGVKFRDTDADIEEKAGKPISEIFYDEGEAHFRALEREAVAEALGTHKGVLSLGGGAILDEDTQALLADHTVIFLDVTLSAAAPRIGFNAARPLLVGSPRRQWRELMEARRGIYERLATHQVDTSGISPGKVATAIDEKVNS